MRIKLFLSTMVFLAMALGLEVGFSKLVPTLYGWNTLLVLIPMMAIAYAVYIHIRYCIDFAISEVDRRNL